MAVQVGDKLTGKVTGITKFGAFVDINENENGLVHISEIANEYVKDINDFVKVGDEVDVVITKIAADGKIALSMKQAQPKPKHENRGPKRTDHSHHHAKKKAHGSTDDFDNMMSSFLKDSEDRLSSLKKNAESKRGGRGGRRGH